MMKKMSKRWLSLLLTVTLLLVCVPTGICAASAEYDYNKRYTPAYSTTALGSTKLVSNTLTITTHADSTEGNDYFIDAGALDAAPTGSWLSFDFDMTAMPYNSSVATDRNCVGISIYPVLSSTGKKFSAVASLAYDNNKVSRQYTRDGVTYYNDIKTEHELSTQYFTVPYGTKGTMRMRIYNNDTGKEVELKDLDGIEFAMVGTGNAAGFNKTYTISNIGYATTVEVAPPVGYVNVDNDSMTYTAPSSGIGSTKEVDFGSTLSKAAPSGSRLAFYFDTTNVAKKNTGGDTDCVGFEIASVWSMSKGGWVDLRTINGGNGESYTNGSNPVANNLVTVYKRNGVIGTFTGKEGAASSWAYTLPSQATGWAIIDMGNYDVKDITALKLTASWGYNNNQFNKTIYLRHFGYVPEKTLLAASPDLNVKLSGNNVSIEVDDTHKVKAGSLLVYDAAGNKVAHPSRVGAGTAGAYDNTTQFTYTMGSKDISVLTEAVNPATSTRPNFGYLGWQTNPAKGGIRSVFRFDITHHEGNAWYNKICTTLGGKTVEVDSFGILLCTKNVYTRIGGANGMVTTSADASLYNTDFHDKRRRVDACAAYEDACFAMLELNKNDTRKGTAIYTRAYMVIDGVTYYSDIYYRSYNYNGSGTGTNGTVSAATAITH